MSTASVFLALSLTGAELTAAQTADTSKVGADVAGLLECAKQSVYTARKQLGIVTGLIGAGTEKTAIDAMVTSLT